MPSEDNGGGPKPDPAQPFRALKDANEFRLAAIHIFGTGWKGKTALAFDVQESTIYRWISEIVSIPHYALSAMAAWKIVFDLTGQLPPQAAVTTRPVGRKKPA
ncbi:hypothetical protein O9X98_15535 [Agrobacterium salinitolerans]|nr:hypothetical protein [Agrobacterium salinitolerans]